MIGHARQATDDGQIFVLVNWSGRGKKYELPAEVWRSNFSKVTCTDILG